LADITQTSTAIRALKVMNLFQITTIYLQKNKNNEQKTVVTM
jgi:hypothetical protein